MNWFYEEQIEVDPNMPQTPWEAWDMPEDIWMYNVGEGEIPE